MSGDTGTLWYEHHEGQSLPESLTACVKELDGGTALLYSPSACLLARYQGGLLQGPDGGTTNLDAVFEARVFNGDAELRWLRTPGSSRTVVVREKEPVPGGAGSEPAGNRISRPYHGTIEQSYILWGEALASAAAGDWASLGTARVGTLHAPLPAGQGLDLKGRMAIRSREYLFIDDKHGNATVGDERLLAMEVL